MKKGTTKTTTVNGFGEMVKDGENGVKRVIPAIKDTNKDNIAKAVVSSVKRNDDDSIDVYSIFQAADANATLKADLTHAGNVRQEMLAHTFWADYFGGNFENMVHLMIIHSPLKNEYKRTMKTTLQRLVTLLSEKTQELVISDPKGGTLEVSIEDCIIETPVQKFANSLGKAVANDDNSTGNTTDIMDIMALVKLAIENQEKVIFEKEISGYSKAVKNTDKLARKAVFEDEQRENKTAEMSIIAGMGKEIKTRKAGKKA